MKIAKVFFSRIEAMLPFGPEKKIFGIE